MATEVQSALHVVFFPFMAYGHMIPTLDMARLFAARGMKTTIITTPLNAPTFTRAIHESKISIEVFRFPSAEAGLPEGCENLDQAMAPGVFFKFLKAGEILREQLEIYMAKTPTHCLVADFFFPWATESSAKFRIPRIVFHGTSVTSICARNVIRSRQNCVNPFSEDEFVIPSLPREIKLTRSQIPDEIAKNEDPEMIDWIRMASETEKTSYGVIFNSFYDLESDFAEFFSKELGRRAWLVGPVSLCNRSIEGKGHRGREASIDKHECLKWLNSKRPNSVIYVCFGSTARFVSSQLLEIAFALESFGQDFIWVVKNHEEGKIPPGFEERMQGKGLIIRGWAPQILILGHEAIGAMMTHCGWNSTMECISAGLPLVTWPVFAEQFFNEKLVTDILKIGISVGAKKWSIAFSEEDMVKRGAIEKAMREMMRGEEAKEMQSRAKKLKEKAWKAVEESGSSYCDLSNLISELRIYNA